MDLGEIRQQIDQVDSGIVALYEQRMDLCRQVAECLYSMSPDETDIKRLNMMQVRNLLAGGKYLYFYQMKSTAQSGLGQIQGVRPSRVGYQRFPRHSSETTSVAVLSA